jgi:hypothetical protein
MTDPVKIIKQTIEGVIAGMTPSIPTAFEGVNFDPPDTIYQRVQLLPRRPDDSVLGDAYYRELVDLQVYVSAPKGEGSGEALDQAERLRNTFPRGWHLQVQDVRLNVLRTPQISSTLTLDSRVVVPVFVSFVCEVG